jgi:ferritin-like metal-binding protein YciE
LLAWSDRFSYPGPHTLHEKKEIMAIKTADDLFLEQLKDIYSAEKQAIRAYPRLTKVVASDELKQALQQHLEETKEQVERLDRAFEILEKRAGGRTCEGMKGLLEEAAQDAEEIERGPILDAALIGGLQRVEHYEIAAYGTVVALAEAMGQSEIQQLLAQTLDEEKETDQKLTTVAKTVNEEAIAEAEEEEEDEEGTEEASSPKKSAKKSAAKRSSKK